MAVTYLEPIPELRGAKAIEFDRKMKDVKPVELTAKEIQCLQSIQINGFPILNITK